MSLQNIIETAFENRADITPTTVIPEVKEAVLETIRQLDSGKLRVAERLGVGEWKVNEWAKKPCCCRSASKTMKSLTTA